MLKRETLVKRRRRPAAFIRRPRQYIALRFCRKQFYGGANGSFGGQSGISLIEVLVSLFIIMVLMMGVYSLIILTLQVTADNAAYVEAMEIANQKMERIRNLPYDDVGTLTGSPAGVIPEYETIYREGEYVVHTTVTFEDDPYDGLQGAGDNVFVDYKIATIEVGWQGKFQAKSVAVFSKIIPNTEETLAGYGLLKLLVTDSMGAPVPAADIHIENDNNGLNVDLTADSGGELTYAVLPDIEAYEITVTKPGYGTERTHDQTVKNPDPTRPHFSVYEGEKTQDSFTIDTLAALSIKTVSNTLFDNWQVNKGNPYRANGHARFDHDSLDNMYYAWDNQTATSSYVYVQKYDSAGSRQWASDLSISSTQYQFVPDIAVLGSGDSFVVWQDNSTVLKSITRAAPPGRLAIDNTAPASVPSSRNAAYRISLTPPADIGILGSTMPLLGYQPAIRLPALDWPLMIGDLWRLKTARAADPAVVEQTKESTNEGGGSSMTATFDSAPQSGNVLIAIAAHRNDWASFNAPTNASGAFTEAAYSDSDWYLDVGIWYKVAGPGEPSAVTITSSGSINGGVLMIMEVSGLDTADLLDVTAMNDQTGGNSNTAYTNATAVSSAEAFALAAAAWGDNNFDTPDSTDWSSDSTDSWTQRMWDDWWQDNDGSLAVATMDVESASAQGASLTLSGGGGEQRNSVLAVFNILIPEQVTTSATGSQISEIVIPDNDNYIGGAFRLVDNYGNSLVHEITLSETGTVDAANDLANIRLYYDLDNSAPYDCSSEQYDSGVDSQFGAASNFDAVTGTSTFEEAGGVPVSTVSTMCLYVVLDVLGTASRGETLNITINNPSQDIVLDSGDVLPASSVEPGGDTELKTPAELQQIHYRWRYDNGNENAASWKQAQDNASTINKENNIRLRLEVYNNGSLDSDPTSYRLEYGEKTTTCQAIAAWTPLPFDNSQHWRISDSAHLNDGASTTNILDGLTDEGTVFEDGDIKDNNNSTYDISLGSDEFTELEYSVSATAGANDSTYCFRLSDQGSTAGFTYTVYPEVTITGDDNIYIISLDANGNANWAVKRINTDIAGENQINPRIAATEQNGSPTTTVAWEDYRNGNSDIYAQITDQDGNKLWGSDLRITASATDEYDASIVFNGDDEIVAAWTDNAALSRDVYMQKIAQDGSLIWPQPKAVAASGDDEYEPELAVDSSGNIYISWTEVNTSVKNVYLAKYSQNGVLQWSQAANQENSTDEQSEPSIAVGSSYLYVAWTDDRENNLDVYSSKMDLNGNYQWAEDIRLNINTGVSPQNSPVLLVNTSADPYAAWTDDRNNRDDIYSTAFNDPVSPSNVGDVPLIISGTKQIGDNPVIYETVVYDWTDAGGDLIIPVEWDIPGYSVSVNPASSSLDIILRDPIQPLELLAGEAETMTIYVE